ncbi:MAG: efflux RND transporter permease subunit [Rhodothermales bacterium]|nr:efflux RND transporter permease subunit [Rhodothermales bacterium]MBO6779057.1 efflux RND transporter permease subunit [Rhodothermales bacterium]
MRTFIRLCFRRPVAVTAFYTLVVVAAAVGYWRLPVTLLPDVRYPTLVVWTAYPDVPPERVERAVTERVEEAVAGTDGLRNLTSRSMLGGSLVRLDFGWNTRLDLAMLHVREQLDKYVAALPLGAERPTVLRLNPNDRPIMVVALSEDSADETDLVALKRLGQEVIARRLEQIPDVARVVVTGGFDRRVDVVLDPARMSAYGLTLGGVRSALGAANVAQPGGSIRRGPFRFAVEVSGEFESVDDVRSTIVRFRDGVPVRLQDIADVREGVDERRGLVRYDGRETLMLLIERRPDANTVRAAEEVRSVLAELEAEVTRASLSVVLDESVFIRSAIGGVAQAVLVGGLLAILVLLVFLRRRRALMAVAVAVPLSLCLTLVIFDALDVSFNLISLSGLALGVGMLVDNAIVVVENIARLRDQGMSRAEAGVAGVSEVAGAVTASTLTTIAVFLPITFVEGLAGRLFLDQSLAVIAALLASLLVALTVVPLVASAAGSEREDEGARGLLRSAGGLVDGYERVLAWSIAHRPYVLGAMALLLLVAGWIGTVLPRELVPRTDQGRVEMEIALASDADLPLLSERSAQIEQAVLEEPGVAHVLADLGERDENRLQLDPRAIYEGEMIVLLQDDARAEEVDRRLASIHVAADVSLETRPVRTQLEVLLASEDADLQIDLVSERREAALPVLGEVMSALAQEPALSAVRVADDLRVPAYRVEFKRQPMARHRVTTSELAAYLSAAGRGVEATELRSINEDVPVILRRDGIATVEALLAQRVETVSGPLPLGLFVEAEYVELPAALIRQDQASVLRILADVAPGADLTAAVGAAEAVVARFESVDVRGRVGGASDAFRDSLRAVLLSLLFSVALVFLILAAQFESFLQPLVILVTVPLAAAGVAVVLLLTGQSINLMSLTGCIVLVGIVVNDAIIKIDFANQRRAAGATVRDAVMAAGRDRLRPIIMTTVTTVLGLLPLALGFGSGAELRAPMAIAIAGGLLAATVLTLVVVPVLYVVVSRAGGGGR